MVSILPSTRVKQEGRTCHSGHLCVLGPLCPFCASLSQSQTSCMHWDTASAQCWVTCPLRWETDALYRLSSVQRPCAYGEAHSAGPGALHTSFPSRAETHASEASQMAVRSWPPSRASTRRPPAKPISCFVKYPKPAKAEGHVEWSAPDTPLSTPNKRMSWGVIFSN